MLKTLLKFKENQHKIVEKNTWAIVTTIRAPKTLTDKFVSYYLSLGCSEIHIFFDDPETAEIDSKFTRDKRVHTYICDNSYWKSIIPKYPRSYTKRASNIENRQCANFHNIYNTTSCDWLLHIDIDEYIIPYGNIIDILSAVPKNIFSIGALPYESIYTSPPALDEIVNGKYFKSLLWYNKETTDIVYDSELIPMKTGFWGHLLGKGFCRTHHVLRRLSCHFPTPLDNYYISVFYSRSLELLHFECMSPELFVDKRLGRINKKYLATKISETNIKRLNYASKIYSKYGIDGLYNLYNRMNIINSEDIDKLISKKFIVERSIHIKYSKKERMLLRDYHGNYLYCKNEINIIKFTKKVDYINPVFVEEEPGRVGKIFFYTYINEEKYYIAADKNGNLIPCSSDNVTLFSKYTHNNEKISVMHENAYLRSLPDEDLSFESNNCTGWEMFDLVQESSTIR